LSRQKIKNNNEHVDEECAS